MKESSTMFNRQVLERRYNSARGNLLLVVAFTVINIILLLTESNTYFLFSAYIPYATLTFGMLICGMLPEEYYMEEMQGMEFLGKSAFGIFLVVALIMVALYLISWIFSKKCRVGWLIFALVIFSIDTLGMFAFEDFTFDSIIDIVFHIWVIISLSLGINACCKIKKSPTDEIEISGAEEIEKEPETSQSSQIIRIADLDVKSRVFIESQVVGHTVIYRRVKRINELVIDGKVYDEMEALVEFAHSLKAEVDGHSIEVGYDGKLHSYLKLDGEMITKKVRLY